MNIEKLSQTLDFDVEAQDKPCDADCYKNSEWVGNNWFHMTFYSGANKQDCKKQKNYTSFISKKH